MRGVPRGTLLGQALFSVFINATDGGIECLPQQFCGDTNLVVLEGREDTQRDLERLEKRALVNRLKFNKATGDLSDPFQCINGTYWKDGERLFT